jgi:hypothetical protein
MAKGHKTGGREQGTPNKLTSDMRAILKGIVSSELERISEILEKLEPEKRADLVLKLLPYVLPKVEAVSMDEGEPWNNAWTKNL